MTILSIFFSIFLPCFSLPSFVRSVRISSRFVPSLPFFLSPIFGFFLPSSCSLFASFPLRPPPARPRPCGPGRATTTATRGERRSGGFRESAVVGRGGNRSMFLAATAQTTRLSPLQMKAHPRVPGVRPALFSPPLSSLSRGEVLLSALLSFL